MGIVRRLSLFSYRIVRRLGVASINDWSLASSQGFEGCTPTGYQVDLLQPYEPYIFDRSGTSSTYEIVETNRESWRVIVTVESGPVACLCAVEHDVRADMNHDGDIEAGLPISLPSGWFFIYNAFVEPTHRGQRLYELMLRSLALHAPNTEYLLLTTEWTNEPALRSIKRTGFRQFGYSIYLRLGWFRYVRYPKHEFGDLRVGKFVGEEQ